MLAGQVFANASNAASVFSSRTDDAKELFLAGIWPKETAPALGP
jgi:hypothetical protein